jgi:hypothetical protein
MIIVSNFNTMFQRKHQFIGASVENYFFEVLNNPENEI